jgi:hypothetical protein
VIEAIDPNIDVQPSANLVHEVLDGGCAATELPLAQHADRNGPQDTAAVLRMQGNG